MRYMSAYMPSRRPKRSGVLRYGFFRLITVTLVVIVISSFYIYERVWVRNLIAENEKIERRNDITRKRLADVEAAWMTASSLASIEVAIQERQLGLEPTKPSQNVTIQEVLAVRPVSPQPTGPYTGLGRAWNKLKRNVPVVEPAQVEAQPLFEGK